MDVVTRRASCPASPSHIRPKEWCCGQGCGWRETCFLVCSNFRVAFLFLSHTQWFECSLLLRNVIQNAGLSSSSLPRRCVINKRRRSLVSLDKFQCKVCHLAFYHFTFCSAQNPKKITSHNPGMFHISMGYTSCTNVYFIFIIFIMFLGNI